MMSIFLYTKLGASASDIVGRDKKTQVEVAGAPSGGSRSVHAFVVNLRSERRAGLRRVRPPS
jgi:hypothetical protein